MKFKIPSYATMIKIFLLLGPLFWVIPYFLIIPYAFKLTVPFSYTFTNITVSELITNPLSGMGGGAIVWWLSLLIPSLWLLNWIPTTLTALLYRYLLGITDFKLSLFKSKLFFTIYNAVLSTVVSASVFSFTSFVLYELIQTNSTIPYGVWIGQIAVVSVVGLCLGLFVGFTAGSTNKFKAN